MRVSKAKAEENRRHVVSVASEAFRKNGFDGIGISDLMKAAGATHGGFYKQFGSKDDLIVEATAKALDSSAGKWRRVAEKADGDPLAALVRFYLSTTHRDETARGCGLAALGGEAARHGPALREAFETGLMRHAGQVNDILGGEAEDEALAILSTMVGALVLSRAVGDGALSERILAAASNAILNQPAKPTSGKEPRK